jgi:hypothetical protein
MVEEQFQDAESEEVGGDIGGDGLCVELLTFIALVQIVVGVVQKIIIVSFQSRVGIAAPCVSINCQDYSSRSSRGVKSGNTLVVPWFRKRPVVWILPPLQISVSSLRADNGADLSHMLAGFLDKHITNHHTSSRAEQ